jgi:CRISPR system Cascade subunit CasA
VLIRYDLLDEPLLTWRDGARQRGATTLPGILSGLASGELAEFPRVRTHQFHPWCMFLTQLAAIALHGAGQTDPRLSDAEWRDLLLALTRGRHEPWSLVVEDLAQPAFFQPPVPENTIEGWPTQTSPDEIDVLVTSKAHDVKANLVSGDDIEAWIYALVTLQTTQGYPGRGYNGIARMKGGYGNRPRIGLAPDSRVAPRFLRDLAVLLDGWPGLLRRGLQDRGVGLVWSEPWDGQTALAWGELSPHFIEICWRIRCRAEAGRVSCSYTTTKERRCAPEVENGDVGDPWAPIERDAGVLTVGRRGFHYNLLRRLLFDNDFEPAAAQAGRVQDPEVVLMIASAMARGQGKTEGLHERTLPLPRPLRRRLGTEDGRAMVGRRAEGWVSSAEKMRSQVLFPALKKLGDAIPEQLDQRIDEIFFEHLFASLDDADESARLGWERTLRDLAQHELEVAIARVGAPAARRYRVTSDAERMFGACLRKHFPDVAVARREAEVEEAS